MSPQPTEAEKVARAVAGMPAPQALRFLAELVRPGGSPARGEAIAALMTTIAATLDAHQAVVRDGIAVNSLDDAVLSFEEYAVRGLRLDGQEQFVAYGDRLFAAVRDASQAHESEVLRRSVAVGPWVPNVAFSGDEVWRERRT